MDLRQDIFIIPLEDNRFIIYAPLRKAVFYANENAINVVQKYIKGEENFEDEKNTKIYKYLKQLEEISPISPRENNLDLDSKLIIVLSQLCNLSCYYCYAKETRSKEVLCQEKLKIAIDYLLSNPISDRKRFTFIGGGEPTMTWDLFEWAIEYVTVSKKENQAVEFSLTTNGTLLSDEKISFLKKNNVYVGLSFEILPEIQNIQRKHINNELKSFDMVDSTIYKLIDNGVSFGIRSTITKNNVNLMKDMVDFVSKKYITVKEIRFEHVHGTDDDDENYYDAFIDNFFIAKKYGKEKGIELTNSISVALSQMKIKFCRGEFCITPTGDLVSCHRISSNKDKLFTYYNYGYIDKQIIIEKPKMERVLYFAKSKMDECETCFAKWHCAGDCSVERLTLTKDQRVFKCRFIKRIVMKLLQERLTK